MFEEAAEDSCVMWVQAIQEKGPKLLEAKVLAVVDLKATNMLVEFCWSDGQVVSADNLPNQPLDPAGVIDFAEEVAKDVRVDIPILFLLSRPTTASLTLDLGLLGRRRRRLRR